MVDPPPEATREPDEGDERVGAALAALRPEEAELLRLWAFEQLGPSEIAQTLVTLGVDLSKVNAVGDLQGGIEEAERLLGYQVSLETPGLDAVAMQ